ncbi:hypothetical protein [Deinococcus sp. QL22]|uniref:hypothetical protein n=1 Tax=Deinococcus sp. QL22 TaxID=2939437 RepID=UPI0020178401|nr:hypothetical protein [Deinococcus sp. QL22]UQN10407.1 hypothetical protein M1R55_30095 [Deinococcus sp. QL22]UQN10541.1 hypothetical protein M1R55_29420 [Deinococcus sp. QL22]
MMTALFLFLTILSVSLVVGLSLDLRAEIKRRKTAEAQLETSNQQAKTLAHDLSVSQRANTRLTNELAFVRNTQAFTVTQTGPDGWSLKDILNDRRTS